jgi:hypothetical protein
MTNLALDGFRRDRATAIGRPTSLLSINRLHDRTLRDRVIRAHDPEESSTPDIPAPGVPMELERPAL